MDKMQLTGFINRAKHNSYAVINNIPKTMLPDGGTELTYREEMFSYRDRYYGGEPFIGEEVVISDNTVIWGMNLRGMVVEPDALSIENVYAFLQESLRAQPADASLPFRGPMRYQSGLLRYSSEFTGSLEHFSGTERIFLQDRMIYEGFYHGGKVGKE